MRRSVSLRTVVQFVAILLASIGGGPTARAQQTEPQTTLSGQIELPRLVDLASQRLNVNIEYDASQLKGTVTLRLGAGVSDEELWNLVNRLLASRGFTTIRMAGRDDVLSVVKFEAANGLARMEERTTEKSGSPHAGFVTLAYRLKNRTTKDKDFLDAVKQLLAKQGGSGSGVTALGEDQLVLSDLSGRVDQAVRFIEAMDGPAERVEIVEAPATHLSASQVVALGMQLVAKRDAVGGGKTTGELITSPDGKSVLIVAPQGKHEFWKGIIAAIDKHEAVTTATYSPKYFDLKEVSRLVEQIANADGAADARDGQWRIVEDPLTASIIVTATASQHEQIEELVSRLNAVPTEGRRPLRTFKVRNRSVNDVLAVVQGLVTSGNLDAPGDGGDGFSDAQQDASPAPTAQTPTLSSPATTSATTSLPTGGARRRPGMNTSASGWNGQGSSNGGSRADVTLTADEGTSSIIAMGEPRLLSQIEKLIQQLDVRQPQVMVQALVVTLNDSQSRDLGVELEGQINLSGDSILRLSSLFGLSSAGGGVGERNASGGGTGLLLSPGEFAVVIRALETVTNGRSVSMPQVLVANNQQAVFNSVVEQPYQSTSTSNNVTSNSLGGSSTAGTVITARPQIADGDHLLLEYSVELSAFVGNPASAFVPPPRQTNNVASSATLPDGFTIAVGGLELTTEGDTVEQIPLLGSIPIIGEAFKNRSRSSSRNRFYVFLRAEVMRHSNFEDLKYMSQIQADASHANINDGFPEVEPRIIR